MSDVAVTIPWRHSADRAPLLGYAAHWWRDMIGLEPVIGRVPHPAPDPWRKGVAIADGVRQADRALDKPRIFIVADADVVMDVIGIRDLQRAIEQVRTGRHLWAVPHLQVARHPAEATAEILAGRRPPVICEDTVIHRGHPGGGLVVLNRRIVDERCLPDPRFAGWGQEDDSWAFALRTLYGMPWRGASALHHLWHTPQTRISRAVGSIEGQGLYRRYLGARLNERPMRALVDQGWRWWDDRARAERQTP